MDPLTQQIVAGYLNLESGESVAIIPSKANGVTLPNCIVYFGDTEGAILQQLWLTLEALNKPQKSSLLTFNGRTFVLPCLYLRSSVNRVPIGNFDLLQERYRPNDHVDLLEAFTFHNITTKPTLLELGEVYGIERPPIPETEQQQLLLSTQAAPNPAIWTILAKNGVAYAKLIMGLGMVWNRTLRRIF